ncbi:HAMP domain-containing protein [Pelobacter sp. M08fum]|uniref:histidine kinase n=2 Tax=Pelovirga terrestris TaxID=2771352 RepID=A0A8J6UKZ4_9BACT|nr:HAMP domain-containing protein [Pelovirga terrestris]
MLTSSYFHITQVQKIFAETSIQDADALADLLLRNSYHLMLENDRYNLQLMMEEVGESKRIKRARILGREGVVSFSTNADEVGSVLVIQDESCTFCHISESEALVNVPAQDRIRTLSGYQYMNVTRGIYNEPNCSTAACHAHPPEQEKIGVLDMVISLDQMAYLTHVHHNDVLLSTLVMLVLLSVGHYLMTRRYICKPIEGLLHETKALAQGHLNARVVNPSRDEIGELGHSFNQMAENLEHAQEELRDWGATLEQKVDVRTAEMQEIQNQLIRSAKLASMGELVAGIAHEINNPLTGILMFASLSSKHKELPPQVKDNLDLIVAETGRCAKIVRGLLEFARESVPEKTPSSINTIISQTLELVSHQSIFQDVDIVCQLGEDIPEIELDADQWQQVFVNMIINAGQAMPQGGNLTITTHFLEAENSVHITIEDTGTGISREHLDRIFDPFFTTKSQKGFGLGLSVTYGIIQNHGGKVDVQSSEGVGTRFSILLPVENPGWTGTGDRGEGKDNQDA